MIQTIWFTADGAEIARDAWRSPAPDDALLAEVRLRLSVPDGAIMWQTTDHLDASVPLRATVVDGVVVGVEPELAPPALELWLHVAMDGGTLSPDGMLYLAHGQELQVAATLRQSADPASPAVTHMGETPITYAWAMELADRAGVVRDCPLVQVVEGVSTAVYTPPPGYYGYLLLAESSFAAIGPYRVRLVGGPIVFKIVRAL